MNKTLFIAALFSLAIFPGTYGQNRGTQKPGSDSLSLSERTIDIGEVVVSSLRIDRKVKDLPAPLTVVRASDYQKQSSLTLSNALNREPGISLGGDGIWATNINIRGMNENRLVTLVDGSRVETATDLTASMSMVDVWEIDRVEVIRGALSSLYGTGAMGGIINIITKDGHFSDQLYVSGNAGAGFASANRMYSGHADVNTGSDKWYMRLSGTYTDTDDMRTPEGTLLNSQYTYNNFGARAGFKPFDNHILKIHYQRYMATDVGIPGGEAFPGPSEATYKDIGRSLLSASYEITGITEKLSTLRFSYFNQYIDRNVAVKPNTVTETTLPNGNTQRTTPDLMTPGGKHMTNGGQLQATFNLSSGNTLIAGADVWGRRLTTDRTKYVTVDVINPSGDIIKTNNLIRGETPIPASSFTSSGLFIQDEATLVDDRLTLITGGRIDGVWVNNEEGYDVDYIIINGVENESPARRITFAEGSERSISWSANAGLLYNLTGITDLSFNLARSFRAPSLEERFKYIDLGNFVRLGDPSLKPESGLSADIGVRKWSSIFNFQAELFVNRLSNMIVESPGEFIYTTITGTEFTTDTLPALINSNVSKALLYGFDLRFEYNFYHNFVLSGSGSYVRGRDTETGADLPQIPPFKGRVGLRYNWNRAGTIEVTLAGAAKQTRIGGNERETDGYMRLDLAMSSKRLMLGRTALQVFAGIDNITDATYTNHLSTNRGAVSVEPGRNFFMRANLSF
ncbi:MAG: TonB-dependent receptor [Bacteroidales bacterium]|nr:TonB-dependent receptor [Bacteroidales bacterium]